MISPDYKDLSTGFTRNFVRRVGYQVIKSGPTVKWECKWYRAYRDKNDIPRIYSADPGGITMEYIHSNGTFSLEEVLWLIEKYRHYPALNSLTFQAYRAKIAEHLKHNTIHGAQKLLNALDQLNLPPSFCHGDLSIHNIIASENGMKLIDPLYGEDHYGSYWLDYAKLAFSLKFYKGDVTSFNDIMARTQVSPVLIASECVRVCTYNKRFNFIAENLIDEL